MSGTTFTDSSPHEEIIAWGLPAGRLALVAGATLLAAACLHLPGPNLERLAAGTVTLLCGCGLGWIRVQGVPLATWALRATRAVWRTRLEARFSPTRWRCVDETPSCPSGT